MQTLLGIITLCLLSLVTLNLHKEKEIRSLEETLLSKDSLITGLSEQLEASKRPSDNGVNLYTRKLNNLNTNYLSSLCQHARSLDSTIDQLLKYDDEILWPIQRTRLTPIRVYQENRYNPIASEYNELATKLGDEWLSTYNLPSRITDDPENEDVHCQYRQ